MKKPTTAGDTETGSQQRLGTMLVGLQFGLLGAWAASGDGATWGGWGWLLMAGLLAVL